MRFFFLIFFFLSHTGFGQYKNPKDNIFSDFLKPPIKILHDKIEQLKGNFIHKRIGSKTTFYGYGKKGCYDGNGDDVLQRNTEITKLTESSTNRQIDKLIIDPCRPGSESYTILITREGTNLKAYDNPLADLQNFKLANNENFIEFKYFNGLGKEPLRANLRKLNHRIIGKIYVMGREFVTYSKNIDINKNLEVSTISTKSLSIDFYLPYMLYTASQTYEHPPELSIFFRTDTGQLWFQDRNHGHTLSKIDFENELNKNFLQNAKDFINRPMEAHANILPDTEISKGSATETQFQKELNKAIRDILGNRSIQVQKFLEKTKVQIEQGKLVVIEK